MIMIVVMIMIVIVIEQRGLHPAGHGSMMVVVPGRFELPDHHGKDQAHRQSHGQFEPVMDMELQLRQKVARRNADESARRESEGTPEKNVT